jgi:hypothetical protein
MFQRKLYHRPLSLSYTEFVFVISLLQILDLRTLIRSLSAIIRNHLAW